MAEGQLLLQVLVAGKISQAVVVAAAAYRDTEEFQARTGLTNSKLIDDEFHTNTHVSLPPFLHVEYIFVLTPCL